MVRFSILALLAVGCASAGSPGPRVVERVVYVETPGAAPVIIEQHPSECGECDHDASKCDHHPSEHRHHASRHDSRSKGEAPTTGDPKSKRHAKPNHEAKPNREANPKHRAKGKPPGHHHDPSKWAKASRCDDKPTAEARDNCRKRTARRKSPSPTFGF
jgi:hypothetical protein